MVRTKYQYPEDPPTDVEFMFGAEFAMANPNRETRITSSAGTAVIPVDAEEIICDTCNALVKLHDPCAVALARLTCWTCTTEWILPHLVKDAPVEIFVLRNRKTS